jgi:TPR repeat protein
MAQARSSQTQSIVEELTGPHPPYISELPAAAATGARVIDVAAAPSSRAVADIDPGERPKTLAELTSAMNRSYDLSVTRAGDLNIPVVGSIGGSYNRRVVILERAAYKTVVGHSGAQYHLGYALRLCLTVNKWDANLKASLPFLAASAQMGQIEAGWMLQVLGLAGPRIDAATAPPGELNVETFVIAKQSLTALIEAINDRSTTFSAFQLARIEPVDKQGDDFRRSAARTYAMSRIARRSSLADALDRMRSGDEIVNQSIRDTYEAIAPGGPTDRPTDEAVRKVRELLGGIEADV